LVREKLIVSALFDNLAGPHNDNIVSAFDGRKSMGNGDSRSAF
jgi:hypothetical protein